MVGAALAEDAGEAVHRDDGVGLGLEFVAVRLEAAQAREKIDDGGRLGPCEKVDDFEVVRRGDFGEGSGCFEEVGEEGVGQIGGKWRSGRVAKWQSGRVEETGLAAIWA